MNKNRFNFYLLTACMAAAFLGCLLTRLMHDPVQSLLTAVLVIIAAMVVYETFDKD